MVPRCYRDVLKTAVKAAGFLKVWNLKEEVKLIDLETRKWMLFKDDCHTPEWREPIWALYQRQAPRLMRHTHTGENKSSTLVGPQILYRVIRLF